MGIQCAFRGSRRNINFERSWNWVKSLNHDLCGGGSLRRGAISSVCTFTFYLYLWPVSQSEFEKVMLENLSLQLICSLLMRSSNAVSTAIASQEIFIICSNQCTKIARLVHIHTWSHSMWNRLFGCRFSSEQSCCRRVVTRSINAANEQLKKLQEKY